LLVFFEMFIKGFDTKIFTNTFIKAEYPVVRSIILDGWYVIKLVVCIQLINALPVVRFWNFNTLAAIHSFGFLKFRVIDLVLLDLVQEFIG